MTKALGKNRNIGGLDSRPGASDHYSIFSTLLDEETKILKKHGKPQPQVQYGST